MISKHGSSLLLVACCLFPILSHAADTDYDGKWNATISCGFHLTNGRGPFVNKLELSVSSGRIKEITSQTTSLGKEDTTWEGRVDQAAFSLNGQAQREPGQKWAWSFAGAPAGSNKLSANGGMLADNKKVRDCSIEMALIAPAVATLAANKASPEPTKEASKDVLKAASTGLAQVTASLAGIKQKIESAAKVPPVVTAPPTPSPTAAPIAAAAITTPTAAKTPTAAPNPDQTPLEAKVEAVAGNPLLDLVLIASNDARSDKLRRGVSGEWTLSGDSICVNVGMLFKADGLSIPFRIFSELPKNARDTSELRTMKFYEMLRFSPAQDENAKRKSGFSGPTPMVSAGIPSRSNAPATESPHDEMQAILAYAFEQGFQKRFRKPVRVGLDVSNSTCPVSAVPRAVIDPSVGASLTSTWRAGIERGDMTELFSVTVAEYRGARLARFKAIDQWDKNVAALQDKLAKSPANGPQALYGALNVGRGNINACYVTPDAASAPRNGISLEAVMRTKEFKNFMSEKVSNRKTFDSLDALYADLQKNTGKCTVILGNGPTLATLKSAIDRDHQLDGRLMQEPLSEAQMLAAHAEGLGFKSPEAYLFARSIDVTDAMQISALQTFGIANKDQYLAARKRLEQFEPGAKSDMDAQLQFLSDEKEAVAKGKNIKALRAERAKKEDEDARKYMAALAGQEKKKAAEFPYVGLLSCSINGQKTSVQACLSNNSIETEVELRNGADYHMYKIYDIGNIGTWDGSDMRIDLRNNFALKAQNAHQSLILNLVVKERASGKVLFQKSAAMFGVINVKN